MSNTKDQTFLLDTFLSNLLKSFNEFQGLCAIVSDYQKSWGILVAKHSIVEFILPGTHLFSVQVQLVSFKDLSNSLILLECGWHFGSSWTGHKGLHSIPLIWWHLHRSVQLDVMIEWLARNVWLWYWHKRAKTQLTMWNKQVEEETAPNHLMYNIAKGLLDSCYFSVNGNECQWSFFFKIFVF